MNRDLGFWMSLPWDFMFICKRQPWLWMKSQDIFSLFLLVSRSLPPDTKKIEKISQSPVLTVFRVLHHFVIFGCNWKEGRTSIKHHQSSLLPDTRDQENKNSFVISSVFLRQRSPRHELLIERYLEILGSYNLITFGKGRRNQRLVTPKI